MQDILFVTWNCHGCTKIKTGFPKFGEVAFADNPIGKQGQVLIVIQTYSNTAAKYVLSHFGNFTDDVFTPAMVCCDGRKLKDPDEILAYLLENYG